MSKEQVLLEQYRKLIEIGLHYDQKLWLIPGAGYAVSGILLNAIISLDASELLAKTLIAFASSLVFFGFPLQLIKDRAYQLGNQYAVDEVKKELGMVATSEFSGIQPSHIKDKWFIRGTRDWSAINTVIYIFIITFLAQVGLAVNFLYMLLSNQP